MGEKKDDEGKGKIYILHCHKTNVGAAFLPMDDATTTTTVKSSFLEEKVCKNAGLTCGESLAVGQRIIPAVCREG